MSIELNNLVFLGGFVRLVVFAVGLCLDELSVHSGIRFTDVDYSVFTGAANFIYEGIIEAIKTGKYKSLCTNPLYSPYERSSYRYPPLLAWMLLPNSVSFQLFGKAVFILADILIIKEIYLITSLMTSNEESKTVKHNKNVIIVSPYKIALLWSFNIISIIICTRGSMDSITNYMVLLFIRLLLQDKFAWSGFILGLAIHIRIYPLIYLPAAIYFIWFNNYIKYTNLIDGNIAQTIPNKFESRLKWKSNTSTDITIFLSSFFQTNILNFLFFSILILSTLSFISYGCYGEAYVNNAILYHISRLDHRHNLSSHFYWIYLLKGYQISPLDYDHSHVLKFVTENINILTTLILTLPQMILYIPIIVQYARFSATFPLCLLLQTMIFVTYNKVVTAQYFTWYLCLIPININVLVNHLSLRVLLIYSTLWMSSLGLWLYQASLLEFLGLNTFILVWISSILFFIINNVGIGMIIKSVSLINKTKTSYYSHIFNG
eukprot:gene7743-10520_t